jgi:hypothetical protein
MIMQDKDSLMIAVVNQLVSDVKANDYTAIQELLSFIPLDKLAGYLPEQEPEEAPDVYEPRSLNTPTDDEQIDVARWAMGSELLISKYPAINGEATIGYKLYNRDTVHTRTVTDPTYLDLYKVCDSLIKESCDLHHVFIEDISFDRKTGMWMLSTGS